MNSITMEHLHDVLKKLGPKDLILDVRTPQEFADGHVPQAKNIPVDEIEMRALELSGIENLYIYCRAGRRADVACAILNEQGLPALEIKTVHVVDDGGFPDWEDANFPIHK